MENTDKKDAENMERLVVKVTNLLVSEGDKYNFPPSLLAMAATDLAARVWRLRLEDASKKQRPIIQKFAQKMFADFLSEE